MGSDHCPLVLDTREQGIVRHSYFSFDDQWFLYDGFESLVSNKCEEIKDIFRSKPYSLDKWHGCLQKLRQFLKDWNLNWKGEKRA